MRRSKLVLAALALAAVSASAEQVRTVTATLPADQAAKFGVENLAGTMSLVVAPVDTVTVVATIHAETAELAEAVSIGMVTAKDGRPTLRVMYPTRRIHTFLYPASVRPSHWGHGNTSTRYGDDKVTVSSRSGTLLWAAVEVRIPGASADCRLRNVVGTLTAKDAKGTIALDTASGDVRAEGLAGKVLADTGSGNVDAIKLRGDFSCDTGSGECRVEGFDGDAISCDTGSGDVVLSDVNAARISVDTGSGDVRAERATFEHFSGDTGSGDIVLASGGARLRSISANTGSGDVRLKVPGSIGFSLVYDGNGDLRCAFPDARPLVRHRTVIGYERGDKQLSIAVDTGSGDLSLDPAP